MGARERNYYVMLWYAAGNPTLLYSAVYTVLSGATIYSKLARSHGRVWARGPRFLLYISFCVQVAFHSSQPTFGAHNTLTHQTGH